MRPIYLRLERRTRAHAFVVMLAYKIVRRLAAAWRELDSTVEEAIKELSTVCLQTISLNGTGYASAISKPRDSAAQLLNALDISMPATPPQIKSKTKLVVDTKNKLQKHRKLKQ